MASNYSILVDVQFDTSSIKKQLPTLSQALKGASADDISLSYQAANEIFKDSIQVISAMVDQVFELQNAMVEFSKVSDLSGEALENYVDKLTEMGTQVARTGKPWCLTRSVRMENVH